MRNEKRRKANKLLAWCRKAIARIMTNSGFPRSRSAAEYELRRRKYSHGQWNRWYQVNKRYQKLTGHSLYRWQVR